ncbi:MAG: MFS transporter [Phycisphaerales bacterium]|nr:MFS transporter [Phycisphaerales bacterium]
MRSARIALILLTGINLLNYLDRFILSALVSSLTAPVAEGGLALTDAEAGSLYSGFIIVYLVAAPVCGLLADRFSRNWILAVGVAAWSAATSAGALATGYWSLMLTRMCTGIGESAYATVAPTVISDHFPPHSRARALGVFNSAIPIGAAIGIALGGWAASNYGWRPALLIAGLPGLLLAVCFAFHKTPARGASDPHVAVGRAPTLVEALRIALRPSYGLTVLGYALQTAGFGALGFWAPKYLQVAKGMSLQESTITFGIVIATTGVIGTIIGAWWGDRWFQRSKTGLLQVCALTSVAAAVFVGIMIMADDLWIVWSAATLACLFLVASVGPINSQIVNMLGPGERASGVAMSIVLIHLLGDVPSVSMVGWMSAEFGFNTGLALLPLALVGASVVWWVAIRVEANRRDA